jgi:hypothetical protein
LRALFSFEFKEGLYEGVWGLLVFYVNFSGICWFFLFWRILDENLVFLSLYQGSQTCDFLATLCKFHSLFWLPVNIYIDVKQTFCSEIQDLHTRIRGSGSPEGSIFAENIQNKA